jgi:hypothetical protein
MAGKGGKNPRAGRPKEPNRLMAEEIGLTWKRPARVIRKMGGASRLKKMSPEARAFMLGLAKGKKC